MPSDRRPTALVTGATAGIGRYTALGLARAGFRILLHGRDAERAEAARRWVQERAPGTSIEPLVADLASLAAVRGLALPTALMAPTSRSGTNGPAWKSQLDPRSGAEPTEWPRSQL